MTLYSSFYNKFNIPNIFVGQNEYDELEYHYTAQQAIDNNCVFIEEQKPTIKYEMYLRLICLINQYYPDSHFNSITLSELKDEVIQQCMKIDNIDFYNAVRKVILSEMYEKS